MCYRMSMLRRLALLMGTMSLLSGCGAPAEGPPEEAVAARVDRWLRELYDPDPAKRQRAAEGLGQIGAHMDEPEPRGNWNNR